MQIGTRITILRKLHNMNQKDLARKLGIPTTTLSGYENNHREPPLDVLSNICKIFNINLDFLVFGNIEIINEKIYTLIKKLIARTLSDNVKWANILVLEATNNFTSIFTDQIYDSIFISFENIKKENIKNFYCYYGEKSNFMLLTLESIKNECDITYLCVDEIKYEDNQLDSYREIKVLAQDNGLIDLRTNKDGKITYIKDVFDLLVAIQSKEAGEFEYLDSLIDSLDFD